CAWRGAFSAATSLVTRLAMSSPDPKPCELNPAIDSSSGLFVEQTGHVFDPLGHLQGFLTRHLPDDFTRFSIRHRDDHFSAALVDAELQLMILAAQKRIYLARHGFDLVRRRRWRRLFLRGKGLPRGVGLRVAFLRGRALNLRLHLLDSVTYFHKSPLDESRG